MPPCIHGIGPSPSSLLDRWHSIIPAAAAVERRGTERVRNTCASVRLSGRATEPERRGVGREGGGTGEFIEGESEGAEAGGPRAQPVAVGGLLARSRSHRRRRLLTQSMNM